MKFVMIFSLLLAVAPTVRAAAATRSIICEDKEKKRVFKGLVPFQRNCDSSSRVLLDITDFKCTFSKARNPAHCQVYSLVELPYMRTMDDVVKATNPDSQTWSMPDSSEPTVDFDWPALPSIPFPSIF